MRAAQCDRCKILYPKAKLEPKIKIIREIHEYSEEPLDLCPSCIQALEDFVGGKPTDIVPTANEPSFFRKVIRRRKV